MRAFHCAAALLASLFLWSAEAAASIVVRVDKTTQTMRVIVDGEQRYTWAVSTGRAGYNTPNGSYRPQRLERSWRSRKSTAWRRCRTPLGATILLCPLLR